MFRTIKVKEDTTLEELASTMLKARSRTRQGEASVAQLRAVNPHASETLKAGTVLVVPDLAGLKASAGEPVADAPWTEFKTQLASAFDEAVKCSKADLEARARERAEVAKTLKSTAFVQALNASELPNAHAKQAAQALEEEEKKERDAPERLAAMREAAMDALARLDRFVR